ncbi:hypothetical protein SAMN04488121_104283 [Chitinophaga filiformis]|uniref:Uncharacterized protein n=1 Tax=Chitinophaga filiformis TaxID=104663 RepID=A0A1G7U9K4_CHIFI|nr:hypothetical protein SAMN04488121_104283 [Chitinophaga filiformis]
MVLMIDLTILSAFLFQHTDEAVLAMAHRLFSMQI